MGCYVVSDEIICEQERSARYEDEDECDADERIADGLYELFESEMYCDDLIDAWNEYSSLYDCLAPVIHHMDELDDVLCGWSPRDIIGAITDGFCSCDDYFIIDEYDELHSSDDPSVFMCISDMVHSCINNNDDLNNSMVRDYLDENL